MGPNIAFGELRDALDESSDVKAYHLENLWCAALEERRVIALVYLEHNVDADKGRDHDVRVCGEAVDVARLAAARQQRVRAFDAKRDEFAQRILFRCFARIRERLRLVARATWRRGRSAPSASCSCGAACDAAGGGARRRRCDRRAAARRFAQPFHVHHSSLQLLLDARADPHALERRNRGAHRERVCVVLHYAVAFLRAQRNAAAAAPRGTLRRKRSHHRLGELKCFAAEL